MKSIVSRESRTPTFVLALVLIVALATGACGHNRGGSSHPHNLSPGAALVMGGLAAGILGVIIWAARECDSCGDEPTAPRPYPYPEPTQW